MQNSFNPVQVLLALHSRGQFAEMERQARQALRGNSNAAILNELVGIALTGQKKFSEALPFLQKAVRREARDALFWENLGLCQRELRQFAHAEKSLREALKLRPGNAETLNALGSVLNSLGRLDEARDAFEQTLAIAPDHGPAHFNLGRLFVDKSSLPEAEHHLRRAVACGQQTADVCHLLGRIAYKDEIFAEAEQWFRRAIELKPSSVQNYAYLACTYYELKRNNSAIDLVRQAFEVLGDIRAALSAETIEDLDCFAGLLCHMQLFGDAMRIYEVTAGSPLGNRQKRIGPAVFAARHTCSWQISSQMEAEAFGAGNTVSTMLSSFVALALASTTPADQLEIVKHESKNYITEDSYYIVGRMPKLKSNDRRLRIGYLSSDFHDHATSVLLAGVIEAHDRDRFEVIAYDHSRFAAGAYRDRLIRTFERFSSLQEFAPEDAMRKIAADGPDILIDLKGWTVESWLRFMNKRVAPLQVEWLGFPGTTGAPWIDYVIADRTLIRPGDEVFYSEKVLSLPDCYQPNDDKRESPQPSSRSQCGLPESAFVFGCFNQAYKITPEVFDVWMRLLKIKSDSVLWLWVTLKEAGEALRREAAARGVNPQRLIFAPFVTPSEHLMRIPHIDVALDCFPYTSHTTASDMLWMGVPLVALSGETFASRVSESILTAAGLSDLVTRSLDDYYDLALRLATDADALAAVKARVRGCRASVLFDTKRFTRNLERGLELIWRRHLDGLPPDHIDVPAAGGA